MKNKISIIIPCYNEINTISDLIDKVIAQTSFEKEIIVIDDFSTDGTREIIKEKLSNKINEIILNEKNYGKGFSVRQGINRANGDIILIQDADLEYDPSDYYKLINPIQSGNADVVYGSRFIGFEEKRVLYFWHSVGNGFLTLLSNILTDINLTDMETCYKVFKTEIIKSIRLREKGFGIEPEITAKISRLNCKIYEVGINYFGRTYEEGKKIGIKDGFLALYKIFYYKFFDK